MKRGYLYLVAIMDWHSRAVLSWRLSNTMDADFCVSALEEAMSRSGVPDIFNTDQGAQFTSYGFTRLLRDAGVDGHPNGATDGHLNDAIKSERFSLGRPRLVTCL
jgi:transposase InsO family protein